MLLLAAQSGIGAQSDLFAAAPLDLLPEPIAPQIPIAKFRDPACTKSRARTRGMISRFCVNSASAAERQVQAQSPLPMDLINSN